MSEWRSCKCPTCGSVVETRALSGRREFRPKRAASRQRAELPEGLRCEEFSACWASWLQYRSRQGWPVSMQWQCKQLKMLAGFPVKVSVAALEQSMVQGWQGVFPKVPPARTQRDAAAEWARDLK